MQEWKIQELKHMESRPYRNFWRTKLESGCVWLPTVDSRQLVASPTEMAGLVPRVGVIHFDVEADSDSGTQKLREFILLLYSVFSQTCVQRIGYDNYSRMLVYCMIWLLVWYVHTFICVSVCRTLMPYWKLSENYKHWCRNDQPICKNKSCNESNELSSNNLRFF